MKYIYYIWCISLTLFIGLGIQATAQAFFGAEPFNTEEYGPFAWLAQVMWLVCLISFATLIANEKTHD